MEMTLHFTHPKKFGQCFLNCGKPLDLEAAKQAVAHACSKNITFNLAKIKQ